MNFHRLESEFRGMIFFLIRYGEKIEYRAKLSVIDNVAFDECILKILLLKRFVFS